MLFTVFGASGFIGTHLTAYLRANGHEVFAPPKGSREIFGRELGHVIYAVGLTADFRKRPFATVDAHVCLLSKLLEECQFSSFLYLSSTRVYGSDCSGSETDVLSVNPHDPSDLYNLTKLTGESVCRSCGRENVRVARLSNVVGFGSSRENFVFALIEEALAGKILLETSLDSEKDYVLIEDVVKTIPLICTRGKEFIFNLASGVNLSHRQIVQVLQELTNCRVEVSSCAPLVRFPELNVDLLRKHFEYDPEPVLGKLPDIILSKKLSAENQHRVR